MVFVINIVLGLLLILFFTGVFNAKMEETVALFQKELTHIRDGVYTDFAHVSVSSVALAEQLSQSIEMTLLEHGTKPSDLYRHPELVNTILAREFSKLLNGLHSSKGSGVFLVLNATANPHIDKAAYSRAGLFLRNMEATAVSSTYYDIRYFRGPAVIGRSNQMTILPQWKMEFDVSNADFFITPVKMAMQTELPISRQYYWCPKLTLDNYSSAMMCSVPLIASDHTVMGVAGFSFSSMLFKQKYSPDNSAQSHIFCMFAPSENAALHMRNAMFAGNHLISEVIPQADMQVMSATGKLSHYTCSNDETYLGLDSSIRLYAADSPYEQQEWRVVLLVPKADMSTYIAKQNRLIIWLILFLATGCVALSILLSRKFMRPITKALNAIKLRRTAEYTKMGIPEIDDLMEHLTQQDMDDKKKPVDSAAHNTAMFESFVENITTLSTAERAVFDLYLQGNTAREIADILYLSINTIKTHNKRIYMKLNVSSRKELLVYTQMMQELQKGSRKT
jgi:DNA-binding CsgD family transcriptional regulator